MRARIRRFVITALVGSAVLAGGGTAQAAPVPEPPSAPCVVGTHLDRFGVCVKDAPKDPVVKVCIIRLPFGGCLKWINT